MLVFDWLVHFWRENYSSCAFVSVDFLRSPMALASSRSRRPSANGVPSVLLWLTPYASWVPRRLGTSLKAGRMGIWSKVSRVEKELEGSGSREGKEGREGRRYRCQHSREFINPLLLPL